MAEILSHGSSRSVSPSSIQPMLRVRHRHSTRSSQVRSARVRVRLERGPRPFQETIYKPPPPSIIMLLRLRPTTNPRPTDRPNDPKHYCTCTFFKVCAFVTIIPFLRLLPNTLFQLEVSLPYRKALSVTIVPPKHSFRRLVVNIFSNPFARSNRNRNL